MSTQLPDISLTPCDSSQIHAYGYCSATQRLAIQFRRTVAGKRVGGSVYHYANVTPAMFDELCCAPSVGTWFGTTIKKAADKYPFAKQEEQKNDNAMIDSTLEQRSSAA